MEVLPVTVLDRNRVAAAGLIQWGPTWCILEDKNAYKRGVLLQPSGEEQELHINIVMVNWQWRGC